MSFPPKRILFLRPDAYGDLCLFEPVPRLILDAWPEVEVGVLIRESYLDITPLFPNVGIQWLTTSCRPYRQAPGDDLPALDALRETVRAFAPDCLVAACTEQTWLEAAVAMFLPEARQISFGQGLTDPLVREALGSVLPVDWKAIYAERVPVQTGEPEWEKNLRLAGALLGVEAPRWWPVAQVPPASQTQADQILGQSGLTPGDYVICAAAGTANVQIKSWPAEYYGKILAWLERDHGMRVLLVGHVMERAALEAVCQAARACGADPVIWLGQDGEMPVLGGLLASARFYFGNDTGALHLAAALGRAVVPIFGGGHWPGFQPVCRRSCSIVQTLPCFGCAWDCYFVDAPCVRTISPASVQRALESFLSDDADGRTVFEAEGLNAGTRSLIDTATPRLRFARQDSVARLHQIEGLTVLSRQLDRQLAKSDQDRAARQSQIEELQTLLESSEADRAQRLRQVEELTSLLTVSEADRAARLRQLEALSAHSQKQNEAERQSRLRQNTSAASPTTKGNDGPMPELDPALAQLSDDPIARKTEAAPAEEPVRETALLSGVGAAALADLRSQLLSVQERERAARLEARRLAREMILARRLLKFSFDQAALPLNGTGAPPRLPATLLEQSVYYHIDSCQDEGSHLKVSGWCFRPDPAWDGRETTVTLLFQGAGATYCAATTRVLRWDVATYYAAQGAAAYGGAPGLEGTGFAGKILRESLPIGVDLRLALRLECAGLACEQSTVNRLRL